MNIQNKINKLVVRFGVWSIKRQLDIAIAISEDKEYEEVISSFAEKVVDKFVSSMGGYENINKAIRAMGEDLVVLAGRFIKEVDKSMKEDEQKDEHSEELDEWFKEDN